MFAAFYGVDFSGARLAGLNTWIARIEDAKRNSKIPVFKLTYLERLGGICGADEREVALPSLASLIAESERALWALDFPFGFPVEVRQDVRLNVNNRGSLMNKQSEQLRDVTR